MEQEADFYQICSAVADGNSKMADKVITMMPCIYHTERTRRAIDDTTMVVFIKRIFQVP